jgi:hypothetical protein
VAIVRARVGLREIRERDRAEALLLADPFEGFFLLPGPVDFDGLAVAFA